MGTGRCVKVDSRRAKERSPIEGPKREKREANWPAGEGKRKENEKEAKKTKWKKSKRAPHKSPLVTGDGRRATDGEHPQKEDQKMVIIAQKEDQKIVYVIIEG